MLQERNHRIAVHDAEIERLGVRHQVWRPHVLDLWQRAGVRAGMTVIDLSAGPGYSSFDLAEIVGRNGYVIGIEEPERYGKTMIAAARARGVPNVAVFEADLSKYRWPDAMADAVWCQWGLIDAQQPESVIEGIARTLKPGGTAIFHEYYDYESWRLAPHSPAFEAYVTKIKTLWGECGHELDIGLALPKLLNKMGFDIELHRPVVFAATPEDFVWQWPASAVRSYTPVMVDAGAITASDAEVVKQALEIYEADPVSVMLTPGVIQIVARKPG